MCFLNSYFKTDIQSTVFDYVIFVLTLFLVIHFFPLIKEKLRKKLGGRAYKIPQAVHINGKGIVQLHKGVINGNWTFRLEMKAYTR